MRRIKMNDKTVMVDWRSRVYPLGSPMSLNHARWKRSKGSEVLRTLKHGYGELRICEHWKPDHYALYYVNPCGDSGRLSDVEKSMDKLQELRDHIMKLANKETTT